MCKTESFGAGKEHCIIQTALHAWMLSSKTAVLVCAFRFSCPPCPPHLSKVGVHVPPVPMVAPPMLSSPHDSPFILVLCVSRYSRNSDGVDHPLRVAKYRWGVKFARFSTNKSLYLANDTRYRHGCYGRRIGNHTRAFEWHQFQWPWETSKPVFKVTILFNVK